MFIETILVIESGGPFMGAMEIGSTPKGVSNHRAVLSFYKHFTATRFFRRVLQAKTFHILNFPPTAGTSNANFKISS